MGFAEGVGMVVLVVVASTIGAIPLRAAAKWVEKLELSFPKAMLIVLIAGVFQLLVGYFVETIFGSAGITSVLSLISQVAMISVLVSNLTGTRIGRSFLVSLTCVGIWLGIGLIAGIPILLAIIVNG